MVQNTTNTMGRKISGWRILGIGLTIGFLLNLTGWLGNNFVLGDMWQQVGEGLTASEWRSSIWKDIFSLLPDFLYGVAIVWLIQQIRPQFASMPQAALSSGVFISLVGGITTYFAVANSGFIPWKLALASFALVLFTKVPLALLAGRWLESGNSRT